MVTPSLGSLPTCGVFISTMEILQMKKSFAVLAAIGSMSTVSLAQSSVTMFGVLDLGVNKTKNGSAGSQTALTQGAVSTSRFGVRGVEDLGGGLRAGFHLESQVNPDTGTATSAFWNRRSTVSLLGGWGELRLGRDYNPSSRNTYLFEPWVGTSVGTILNFTLSPTATLGSVATTALRTDNAVAYFTPAGLGGFYGEVMVAPSEGAPGKKYLGLRVGFAAGPVDVSYANGNTKTATAQDFKQSNLGVSYKFGALRVMGLYNVHKYGSVQQKTTSLGLSASFGVGEIRAQIASNNMSGGLAGSGFGSVDDSRAFSLGYVHNLSKRTALYGIVGRITNDGAARQTVGGSAAGMLGGQSSSGYQIGMRHAF